MILTPYIDAAAGSGVGVGTTNPDTKNAFTFNGLVLNNPADAVDPPDMYEIVTIGVNDQYLVATEALPGQDGMQIYIPRKVRKVIHADGLIHAPTLAKLEYKVMQMERYLDPINTFWDDTASTMDNNKGFLPLTFNVPTTDTNYGTGLIPVVAYARCIQRPVQVVSKLLGYSARFQIVWEMVDPRFYHNATQTVSLTNGTTNHTSLTEYPTNPVITLTLSGAPGASTSIKRTSPTDENGAAMEVRLALLSTAGGAAATSGDVVTLDMQNGTVKLNGAARADFLVAGYMSFFPILPGANTIVSSFTNMTASAAYKRAFA